LVQSHRQIDGPVYYAKLRHTSSDEREHNRYIIVSIEILVTINHTYSQKQMHIL